MEAQTASGEGVGLTTAHLRRSVLFFAVAGDASNR